MLDQELPGGRSVPLGCRADSRPPEYMPHSAGSESVRASWYNRPVVDPNAKPEAAVDQDEAIREEIRAKLRTPTGEKVDAPMRRLVATRPQDIAALRLLSSCG